MVNMLESGQRKPVPQQPLSLSGEMRQVSQRKVESNDHVRISDTQELAGFRLALLFRPLELCRLPYGICIFSQLGKNHGDGSIVFSKFSYQLLPILNVSLEAAAGCAGFVPIIPDRFNPPGSADDPAVIRIPVKGMAIKTVSSRQPLLQCGRSNGRFNEQIPVCGQ